MFLFLLKTELIFVFVLFLEIKLFACSAVFFETDWADLACCRGKTKNQVVCLFGCFFWRPKKTKARIHP